jgi:hypothetical protein
MTTWTSSTLQELPQQLDARRKDMRLNNMEFAELLGINNSTWSRTKAGKLPIGSKIMRAIALHFSDLTDLVMEYQAERARQQKH